MAGGGRGEGRGGSGGGLASGGGTGRAHPKLWKKFDQKSQSKAGQSSTPRDFAYVVRNVGLLRDVVGGRTFYGGDE
jgi:hypothetical protein